MKYTEEQLVKILKKHKKLPVGDYMVFADLIEAYFKLKIELQKCSEAFQSAQIQIEAQHKAHNNMTFAERLKFLFKK